MNKIKVSLVALLCCFGLCNAETKAEKVCKNGDSETCGYAISGQCGGVLMAKSLDLIGKKIVYGEKLSEQEKKAESVVPDGCLEASIIFHKTQKAKSEKKKK